MTQAEDLLRSIVGEEIWVKHGYEPEIQMYANDEDGKTVGDNNGYIQLFVEDTRISMNISWKLKFNLREKEADSFDNPQYFELADPDLINKVRGRLRRIYMIALNMEMNQ